MFDYISIFLYGQQMYIFAKVLEGKGKGLKTKIPICLTKIISFFLVKVNKISFMISGIQQKTDRYEIQYF